MVLKQTHVQHTLQTQDLDQKLPGKVLRFVEAKLDDYAERGVTTILESPSDLWELEKKAADGTAPPVLSGLMVGTEKLNHVRFINKYLESINDLLVAGGYFVGCVETAEERKNRILEKYPKPISKSYYVLDYGVKRVLPKVPHARKVYFGITKGRNRVISEMETYGRLFSCGYRLVDSIKCDGLLYFIAQKVDTPDFNMEATYGPLIKLKRIGKGGKLIKVYKFRTMYPYSEYLQAFVYDRYGLQDGGKLNNDPRINTVGRLMRRYWLDELPMLINLLRGDLKIVGVRPISRHYMSLYPEAFQEYRKKFKPGLIPPFYADLPTTLEEIVASEERYLRAYEKSPLATDLRYLYRSFVNIFFKKARSN